VLRFHNIERTRVVETSRVTALLAALLILIWSPIEAFVWGYSDHRIIAEIAEQFLEPETARQVRDLLAIENVSTLAEVSTWADQIRAQRPETAPWHYVDIPVLFMPAGASDPVIVPYVEHVPPSDTAGIFWLKNRRLARRLADRGLGRTLMRRIVSALEETKSPMTAVVLAAVHAEVFASG
jgi:S1/P1 Nuclease